VPEATVPEAAVPEAAVPEAAVAELEVDSLSVRRGPREVLRDVSFRVARGEVLAILGPNGAGKSTLLKAVAGLLPHHGTVRFRDADAATLDPRARARHLAYVPQRSALTSALRVEEVVAQGRYAQRGALARSRTDPRVEAALAAASAEDLAGRLFPHLSVGEQQRVLLARALATDARLLLLDEPTSALDARRALETLRSLRALAREDRAIVVVLHHLDDALRFTDRCLLLRAGELVASGSAEEVIAEGPVAEVYDVRLRRDGLRFDTGDDT